MKPFLALLLASCCAVAGSPAMAGTASGTVKALLVRDSDGLIWVSLNATPTGRPACALSQTYFIIPNETSETGKRLYSLLLAAQLSGRIVQIDGKNTCTRWGDGEDIDTVGVF